MNQLNIQNPNSIQSAIANPKFAISPNPVTNELNITVDESLTGALLNIYNITGAQVSKFLVLNSKSQIDCTAFPYGIYVAEIRTATGSERVKWVKM
jgi:hypothetical protein